MDRSRWDDESENEYDGFFNDDVSDDECIEGSVHDYEENSFTDDDEKYLRYFWKNKYLNPFKAVKEIPNLTEVLILDDLRLALKRDQSASIGRFFSSGINAMSQLDECGTTVLDYSAAYAAADCLSFILKSSKQCDLFLKNTHIGSLMKPQDEDKVKKCMDLLKDYGIQFCDKSYIKIEEPGSVLDVTEEKQNNRDECCGFELVSFSDPVKNFLSKLGIDCLYPLFKTMPFHEFLELTEEDLGKMGIFQYGYKKKILQGIENFHVFPWSDSSLIETKCLHKLNAIEILTFFKNMKFQLQLMNSSMKFAKKLKQTNKCENANKLEEIEMSFHQAKNNMEALCDEVLTFSKTMDKICDGRNLDPPHLITHKPENKYKHWIKWAIITAVPFLILYSITKIK